MIRFIIFEGAGSSSEGETPVTDLVKLLYPYDLYRMTLRIQSTRKMVKRLRPVFEAWPPETVVCIGKSLGAIRMFRALKRLGVIPRRVISIDPLSAPRMIFPMQVKPPKRLAAVTQNFYQSADPNLRGVKVRGAQNIYVPGVTHQSIVVSPWVQRAIKGVAS